MPVEPQTVREWAEAKLLVTEGPLVDRSRTPVRWSSDAFPLQRAWVTAVDDGHWASTLFLGSPQATGKTEAIAKPVLLHALDHRQANCFYIAGNADLANTQWGKRLEPAIAKNETLAGLLFENDDQGGNRLERKFTNGCSLFVCGSESYGNLSAKTGPVIICDDVQSYGTIPGFGSPADIAATRTGSYPSEERTIVYIGTSGTVEDWLYRTLAASAFFLPFVPCLGCGTYQLIEFERFQFDRESIAATKADTWMKCANPECDHHICFAELPEMLTRHVYVSTPPGEDWVLRPMEGGTWVELDEADIYPETKRNTNVGGFWCGSALYWPFGLTWGEHAAEYISRSGDPERLKDWYQQILNRPYKEPEIDEDRLTDAEIFSHSSGSGYAAGTVPIGADIILVTSDVQSGYVYYVARAWQRATGSSWLIDMGTFGKPIKGESELSTEQRRKSLINKSLDELDAYCRTGWPNPSGEIIHQLGGAIDIGFESDIVGSWWTVKHRRVWKLIRGLKAGTKGSMWPREPLKSKRQWLYRDIDVNQAKHILRELQRIPHGEPGYQAMPDSGLHANTLRAYARHMTSERFNRKLKIPRWEPITVGASNHLWDCEVYQVCLAFGCGVKLPVIDLVRKAKQESESGERQQPVNTGYAEARDKGGYMARGRTESWKIGR